MERVSGGYTPDVTLESLPAEPLLGREYQDSPEVVHERLRQRHGAVAPVDLLGVPVWLVLGYPEALHVLQNDAMWPKGIQHWRARNEGRVPDDWPVAPALVAENMMARGGPNHAAYRAAWDAALKPFQDPGHPQTRRLKDNIRRTAKDLITLLAQGGRSGIADLAAQFSRPLPLMVAGELLGASGSLDDEALMDIWRILDAGPASAQASERVLAAMGRLGEEKRSRPGEDFPSYLLAARPNLTAAELAHELTMLMGMIADHGGILIANSVVEIITGDGRARASLSAGMIREAVNHVALRKPPLANFVPRFPVTDQRLGEYIIRAGEPVWIATAATHTDVRFAAGTSAHRATSTRAHLSWGAGPRQCPARELATTITTLALESLFEQFEHLELAVPVDRLPWRSSPFVRGLRALPIRYQLRAGFDIPVVPATDRRAAGERAAGEEQPVPAATLRQFLTSLVTGKIDPNSF
ncbi:cytochrome P450 [Streptomyces sp. MnatMP-M17]|uniref:cytochrome P450 n=1 Tax=unclassified Streptomyces TaxID=2593676 RepID=UPI00081EF6BF|nr:cytochrome P450 [Streptomyces sp. MnatMP-M17]MYZ35163.1 cytochrome [Streptomyces sp. SID4917]SCF73238.1 Cytochrome P450 [Streptomyces sp. MnatMP-M17]